MRKTFLIVASAACLFLFTGLMQAQSVPDAPQPQKKTLPKAQPAPKPPADSAGHETPGETSAGTPPADDQVPGKPAAKDDNAFPEDVSRAAAKAAGNGEASKASSSDTQDGPKKQSKDDNAFPEDVSRAAAKAAQHAQQNSQDQAPAVAPKNDVPPGESSSQSSSSLDTVDVPASEVDPVRAKKDIEVGSFYLKSGDYKGALLRYQEATVSDPTNVEAIFGLAETQRMLSNKAEAVRNYQTYLAIVPDGPRAKQSLKALKTLQAQP